jgi:hypothetical protein
MPKTVNGLWDGLIDFDQLYHAYTRARLGKRYHPDVLRYAANVEENLISLQNHLVWGSWSPGRPREFVVYEPKRRAIQAPPFADRVLHHAMVGMVEPIFERKFIHDSYACRRDKGTQRAVARVQQFIRAARHRWGDGCYVVKADISRYFASIRHDVLMREFGRAISDRKLLDLWRVNCSGYGHDDGIGIPVGALTSQLSANIVLNRLDHMVKDGIGLRYYVRYMDDFVAILPDKSQARAVLRDMTSIVNGLGLSMNPKTAIHPWQRGIDFCGYRIWPTHILPRKRNIKRARRDFRTLAAKYSKGRESFSTVRNRVMSFLAYTKHCQANKTVEAILGDLVLTRAEKPASEKIAGPGLTAPPQ